MGFCVCGADDWDAGWQRWDDHPAAQQWEVVKDLGAGALSQVVLGRHRKTGELAALKVVFLQSPAVADDPEHLALLQRESDLLAMLEHPHLVELRDVVRSPKQLVLVLEWLRGGQVIDRLHELGLQYSEQQAAAVFAQAAAAVAHLHEYGVLHRDIKPENLMFATPPGQSARQGPITAAQLQSGKPLVDARSLPVVKLVDLGMACLYDPAKPATGPLGSAGFVAPEVVKGGVHTPAMDVFSLGVLLFVMLVGRKPFNIRESESLRYAWLSLAQAPGLADPRWRALSPDAKHLLSGMLAFDPARRLTMQQVLAHEWVASRGGVLPRPLSPDVVLGAATVASVRRLRNLCGGVAALNRAAAAAGSAPHAAPAGGGGGPDADAGRDAYLRRLKQSQRLDPSARRGTLGRLATSLASNAYAKAHDAGGSVHPRDDVSVRRPAGGSAAPSADGSAGLRPGWRRGSSALLGGSLHGVGADPSASRRARYAWLLPGGMAKAPTTVMLSEMDRPGSREASRQGARGGGGAPAAAAAAAGESADGLERRPSTLQLLSAAARVYLDGSTHGSKRGGSLAAAAGAAAAPGAAPPAAPPVGGVRRVADDGGGPQRRQPGAAALEASTASSESSYGGPGGEGEARRRSLAAAAPRAAPRVPPLPPLSGGSSVGASPRDAPPGGGAAALADQLRPHRVVRRQSLDNPMLPAGGTPGSTGKSWREMQALLRQQTPRSAGRSREGTGSSSAPTTRVVRLKPLE